MCTAIMAGSKEATDEKFKAPVQKGPVQKGRFSVTSDDGILEVHH